MGVAGDAKNSWLLQCNRWTVTHGPVTQGRLCAGTRTWSKSGTSALATLALGLVLCLSASVLSASPVASTRGICVHVCEVRPTLSLL